MGKREAAQVEATGGDRGIVRGAERDPLAPLVHGGGGLARAPAIDPAIEAGLEGVEAAVAQPARERIAHEAARGRGAELRRISDARELVGDCLCNLLDRAIDGAK